MNAENMEVHGVFSSKPCLLPECRRHQTYRHGAITEKDNQPEGGSPMILGEKPQKIVGIYDW